jgi:hypothetical protein
MEIGKSKLDIIKRKRCMSQGERSSTGKQIVSPKFTTKRKQNLLDEEDQIDVYNTKKAKQKNKHKQRHQERQ